MMDNLAQERLLYVLAEQLKLPLLQIARASELGTSEANEVTHIAEAALRLIDGYILALNSEEQASLPLEPVSISALLQETAHRLDNQAKHYNCELQIHIAGRYGPVMANRQGLEAALMILGQSFIEAQTSPKSAVLLATHRSNKGLVAGVFESESTLTTDMFKRAKALQGVARQPLTANNMGGAGVFVANSLMELMSAPLHVVQHNRLTGLGSTLLPSQQLRLVTA